LIVHRDHPVIKAASPVFCLLILFGCVLGYVYVIIIALTPTDVLCAVQPFIGHAAFALSFASLFAKTYRVAKIFGSKNLRVTIFRNGELMVGVGSILVIVLIYIGVWVGVAPPVAAQVVVDSTSYTTCVQSGSSFWSDIILIVEGVALLYLVYLAVEVRNVPTEFNEAKFIGLSIYTMAMLGSLVCSSLSLSFFHSVRLSFPCF
jgi:hypothetical protein